jgi:hypothetical protein
MRRNLIYAHCLIAISMVTGCADSSFDVAPVHGKVTADGKPLFQGKVMFAPVSKGDVANPGKPAWSKINEDGTYRLTTFKTDDGAVVGEHWVTVINSEEDLPEDVPEFARLMLPERRTVVAGKDNQHDIALTSAIIEANREDDR